MNMTTSLKGQRAIVHEEGEKLEAYRDSVGIWTIGVGHTGYVDANKIGRGMKITREKSREILRSDLVRFERAVNASVKVALVQHQFDALVSLVFNIGTSAFSGSTLLKLLNKGDYSGAANEFLKWKHAGGRPILLARRTREKAMFERGVYVQ